MPKKKAVGIAADQDARTVLVGPALEAEMREGAVGMGQRTGNLLQCGDPCGNLATLGRSERASKEVPLFPANSLESLLPPLGQVQNHLPTVVRCNAA